MSETRQKLHVGHDKSAVLQSDLLFKPLSTLEQAVLFFALNTGVAYKGLTEPHFAMFWAT